MRGLIDPEERKKGGNPGGAFMRGGETGDPCTKLAREPALVNAATGCPVGPIASALSGRAGPSGGCATAQRSLRGRLCNCQGPQHPQQMRQLGQKWAKWGETRRRRGARPNQEEHNLLLEAESVSESKLWRLWGAGLARRECCLNEPFWRPSRDFMDQVGGCPRRVAN